jgi:hypothetical protein
MTCRRRELLFLKVYGANAFPKPASESRTAAARPTEG